MKYLLTAVNAKYIHSNPAVYSLRAYAGPAFADRIEIAEYTINETAEEILSGLYLHHPDWIGFSCYIWNREMIGVLLPEIKKVLPQTELWLGGPEVARSGPEILKTFPDVQGIFTGEGELAFSALVRRYESGSTDLSDIPGLYYRNSAGGFTETPPAPQTDLNALPFLYTDLERFKNRILYYESSRGCPFRCSYCLSSIEKSVRLRRMDLVKKELSFFLTQRVKQVKFIDRTFNCNTAHAMEIWQYLLTNDNGLTNFHFELEADLLTEDELRLISGMRPGLIQTEIGVQSTNPETLKAVNRKTNFSHLSDAVGKLLANGNVHVHLDLIAGLPFEDYESFRNSFRDVYLLRPHELQLGFLKVLKGAPIEKDVARFGIRYLSSPPYEVLSTDWLSYKELLQLKKIEKVLGIYYNSGQFSYTMRVLERFFPDPFALYEALAAFYTVHGYFVETPARIRRYDILFDFIAERVPVETLPLFRELLTCDAYLRENLKTRPAFSPALPYLKANAGPQHTEFFSYPLDQLHPYGSFPLPNLKPRETPLAAVFDYTARDPVTGNVRLRFPDDAENKGSAD